MINRNVSVPENLEGFMTSLLPGYDSQNPSELNACRLSTTTVAPHAVFTPMHYEPGYAYPLVIWLHGAAGNERQLRRIMPLVSMRNYVAIAPRGTAEHERCASEFGWDESPTGIENAEAGVFECISIARGRFNVHPERIFLVGYASGGTMAMRIAWNNPGTFAGVATIGGPLPDQRCPLRNINRLRQLPCFLATARHSRFYPESQVCRDLRLLHAAGFTVALRQYTCGDELTTAMLADLNRWAMQLVSPAS